MKRRLQLLEDAGRAFMAGDRIGEGTLLDQVDELNRQIAALDAILRGPA